MRHIAILGDEVGVLNRITFLKWMSCPCCVHYPPVHDLNQNLYYLLVAYIHVACANCFLCLNLRTCSVLNFLHFLFDILVWNMSECYNMYDIY